MLAVASTLLTRRGSRVWRSSLVLLLLGAAVLFWLACTFFVDFWVINRHVVWVDPTSTEFVTPTLGCSAATFIFHEESKIASALGDCTAALGARPENLIADTLFLRAGDSVYVQNDAVLAFSALPLRVPIVVIIGQVGLSKNTPVPAGFGNLLRNPLVCAIFMMHPPPHLLSHARKVRPWPYGLPFRRHLFEAFVQMLKTAPTKPKTRKLFLPHIETSHRPHRVGVLSGPKLSELEYYAELARSKFVLSPDGDRPDCFRNYEALAFGAIPVVSNNMAWLQGAVVLPPNLDYQRLNSTALESMLDPLYATPLPTVVLRQHWQTQLTLAMAAARSTWAAS